MICDAIHCSIMLLRNWTKRGQDLDTLNEFATCCIGLENLISKDVMQSIKAVAIARKVHVRAVIAEQARQKKCNLYSPSELARVSCKSSKLLRERSHKVGLMMALGE
jgi:hypothetical protein